MSIDVRGGVGGIGVGLDCVQTAAWLLLASATDLAAPVASIVAAATDPRLLASTVLSPLTAARAEAALVHAGGPLGLAGQAAALVALGELTLQAVAAYREGEQAVTAATSVAQEGVMAVVGAHAPQVAVGVLALQALGVDVGAFLDHEAYEHPVLSDLGGHPAGLLVGLATSPLTEPAAMLAAGGRLAHRPPKLGDGPADLDAAAVGVLSAGAGLAGLLQEGPARAVAEASPRPGARAPVDVASLARDLGNLSDGADYPAHVRVVEVPGEHGCAWLVEISGTQVWDPQGGDNPFDVTSDAHLMAQESSSLADGVQQALARAQAATGRDTSAEPVLLAGHSLGGIVAAGLAASPRFREAHHVTHVVTFGSPVARMPVPTQVRVLSLEHAQDAVPRLDGRANPDRADWVTVTRDLRDDPDQPHSAAAAHESSGYATTGAEVDSSPDPSVADWRASSRAFFDPADGRSAVVRDYRVVREALPGGSRGGRVP